MEIYGHNGLSYLSCHPTARQPEEVCLEALGARTLECYATPWPLWRESRILWRIVETSFAFGDILSLSPSLIAVSFLSLRGLMPACSGRALL